MKTRNFTRPIEECEVGENKTVCFPFKKNVCKSRILPGTCATVSYLVSTITRCPPDYILFDPDIHTPLNSYSTAIGPRRKLLCNIYLFLEKIPRAIFQRQLFFLQTMRCFGAKTSSPKLLKFSQNCNLATANTKQPKV